MSTSSANNRVIVIGGHTRSIGKTQLVCDIIAAFPQANWIAGKITQYGHGVCAQNGATCDCAPDEHIRAISWEQKNTDADTDSARFVAAGARKSFWLRTKQGFLAEGMPLFREALQDADGDGRAVNVIIESNTLLQFLRPSLYLMVLHPGKADFKDSARLQVNRASAYVLREGLREGEAAIEANQDWAAAWKRIPPHFLRAKPLFLQREGERLPVPLVELIDATINPKAGQT
jgi:hypothetical protein